MDLPEPLVPSEVDLRDFAFMPVDIVRLFNSEFHANANDGEWRAGVTLWLKSYHQVPAASIPDDDVALARLAELGRDVKEWRRIKAGALRGWKLCKDGRLYHPVVAEKAIEGWNAKLVHHWRRDCDRQRKENKSREKDSLPPLPLPGKPADFSWNSERKRYEANGDSGRFPTEPVRDPPEAAQLSDGKADDSARIPLEKALKGQGQGQGQGQLSTSLRSVDNSVLPDGPADPEKRAEPPERPPPDPDADLFRRAREVLGPSAGGLVSRLKRHFGDSIAKSRAALETASTKHDPREYLGRVLAVPPNEVVPKLRYDPGL